jgi:cytochrome c2
MRNLWAAAYVKACLAFICTPSAADAQSFYTAQQAERGKSVFVKACSACHVVERQADPPVGLAGAKFLRQWRTVNDLFSKVSLTMPANHVLGLSRQQYLDVVAFLLDNNGLRPGVAELTDDREQMRHSYLKGLEEIAEGDSPREFKRQDGYYSTQQAARGREYFKGSCGLCHTTDSRAKSVSIGDVPQASRMVEATAPEGLQAGNARVKVRLVGEAFFDQWDSVGALMAKARASMPAYDAGGLARDTYLDIVAYLLSANGMPAGDRDLPTDIDALLDMPLEHSGFKRLFNGQDFTGFRFLLGHNCTAGPDGCGFTGPGDTFKVEGRTIHCSGSPLGYMYTDGSYLNFTLRLEYRFDPQPQSVGEPAFYGNSGWLLFIRDLKVWPKTLEIQGQEQRVLDIIPIDARASFRVDDEARARALKPMQWNLVEIQSKGGQIKCFLNGVLVSVVTKHEFNQPGHIGFQSEGGGIRFRNILIRPE